MMLKTIWVLWMILQVGVTGRADDLDDFIRRTMVERHLPGVSMAVARNGQILKHAAYGQADVESGTSFTVETVLPVLSVTKSFTAIAVMMLLEQGKLRLDDAIGQYLTGLPAAWAPVTIRDCLTHTAGIRSFEAMPGYFQRIEPTNPTETDLLRLLAPLPLDFKPGDRWSYSNTGYVLLGMLIEKISGQTYAEFLAERVFKPAALASTRALRRDTPVQGRAPGYTWREGRVVKVPPFNLSVVKSIGSIESTSGDLVRWIGTLTRGDLLRPSTLELMWSPARLNDGSEVKSYVKSYGLGWWIGEHLGHRMVAAIGGPWQGFFTTVYYFPNDQLTVVFLANSDAASGAGQAVTREIADHYLAK